MRTEQAVNGHRPQVYWGAPRNLGLDLVRATEAAALAAGRWMGLGQREKANEDADAASAMGGGMPGRLSPQSAGEEEAVPAVGLDTRQILACGELISCNEIFFLGHRHHRWGLAFRSPLPRRRGQDRISGAAR